MKAVVAQQQIVVAHQWVSDSAETESRAQQARTRLEVCDGDEPSAGEANTEGCLFHLTKDAPDPGLAAVLIQARPLSTIIVLIVTKVSLSLGPAPQGSSEPQTSLTPLTLTSPSHSRLQSFCCFQLHPSLTSLL